MAASTLSIDPHGVAPAHGARRAPERAGADAVSMDVLTARALDRVREAPPHERLLALAGCTLSEFATRVAPPVSRSRLRDVFAQAEAHGRLTEPWAARLGAAVDAPAAAILALFGIETPARRGRPPGARRGA